MEDEERAEEELAEQEAEAEAQESGGKRSLKKWIGAGVVIALIAAVIIGIRAGLPVREYIERFLEWTRSIGIWGPVVVVGFYVVSCVLFLPGSIITMGAGLLFGLLWGFVTVSIGSTVGACAAFLIARWVARDWVSEKISGMQRFEAIDKAVGREGFKIVLLIRLSPIFPFNLQNYAFGLTRVSFWKYALASWIGMIPGTIMYVYLGTVARSLAQIAAGEVERTMAQRIFFWAGLVVTVIVVVFVTSVARRAVKRAIEDRDVQASEKDEETAEQASPAE